MSAVDFHALSEKYGVIDPARLAAIAAARTGEKASASVLLKEAREAMKVEPEGQVLRPETGQSGGAVASGGPQQKAQIDIASMQSFGGLPYFLCMVDVFTRRTWLVPLVDKTPHVVLQAYKLLGVNFSSLHSDAGSEFLGDFAAYCREKGISQVSNRPTVSIKFQSLTERFSRQRLCSVVPL